MLQLSFLSDAPLTPSQGGRVITAGDRSLLPPIRRSVAGFSRVKLYHDWQRKGARYRRAKKAHHGQRAAWLAYRDATAAWLAA